MKIKITPQAAAVEPKTYVLDDEPQDRPRLAHTPGPWHLSVACDLIGTENPDGSRTLIAQTYGINYAENSRLIAAAPELLEACKYVVSYHREHDSGEGELFGLDFVTTCIAAIAKATGGQQ